jgi:hypothetical protein
MDTVSIGILILLGAGVVWMVVRAWSNSRHAPPTKRRGGMHTAARADDIAFSIGEWKDPEAPGNDPPRR